MKRFYPFLICCMALRLASAQAIFSQSEVGIFIGDGSFIHSTGDLIFSGPLTNDGLIEAGGHVDFADNLQIGGLRMVGTNEQIIAGGELDARFLEMSSNGRAVISSSRLTIENQLTLTSGYLSAIASPLILNSATVIGGSDASFVEGELQIVSMLAADLTFPLGINGNFLPLTIHTAPAGIFQVGAMIPDPSLLIPGDSLIGVADEASWQVRQLADESNESRISVGYVGLDLQNFPHTNRIRARNYAPVLSALTSEKTFRSLEVGTESTEVLEGSGTVFSRRDVLLSDSIVFLAVGVTPVSDELHFYVPSTFVPSSGNVDNQKFRGFVIGTEILATDLRVWNELNNLVFSEQTEATILENTGWDGRLKSGKDAPQGVYYYTVQVSTASGDFEKKGTVLLLR